MVAVTAAAVVYEAQVVQFARANVALVRKWERDWAAFVAEASRPVMALPPMRRDMRAAVHLLAAAYRMDTESVDEEPHRSVILRKRADTRVPTLLLSDACMAQPTTTKPPAAIATATPTPPPALPAPAAARPAPATAWGTVTRLPAASLATAPVNAVRLRGVDPDADLHTLSGLLQSALGPRTFELKRIDRTTVVLLPLGAAPHDMAQHEVLLASLRDTLADSLSFLFGAIDLCWGTFVRRHARRTR
jgi:hypothetical protein